MMYRIVPILFILAAIGLFVWYVNPTYTQVIASENQQIASDNSALVAASTFSDKEAALLAKKNAIDPASITRLEDYLPDSVNNIQLIIDLEALAARSGIALSGFSIQADQTDSSSATDPSAVAAPLQSTSLTDSLSLSVTATGTYQAFQTFLTAAEQSLRPLDIMQIDVKDSSTGVYTYDITFRIYWLH